MVRGVRMKIFLYLFLIISCISLVASENYNLTFPIQMKDGDGQLFDGSKTLTYRLKDSSGINVYNLTETKTINDGILNVVLGDLRGLNYSRDAFFSIQVSGESESSTMHLANSWDALNNPWNWDGTSNAWLKNQSVNVGIGMIPNSKLSVNGSINVTAGNDVCIIGGNCLSSVGAGSGDIDSVNTAADSGLQGGDVSGDVNLRVNTSLIQSRVTGTCGVGTSVRSINETGGVVCETDTDTDTQTLSFLGTNITISGGNEIDISGIDTTCSVDQSCPSILYDSNVTDFLTSSGNNTLQGSLIINGDLTVIGNRINATVQDIIVNGSFNPSLPGIFSSGLDNPWLTLKANNLVGALACNNITGAVSDLCTINTTGLITASGVPGAETDSAHDECSEVSGCVVGAITDGNTGWDNSYGFFNSVNNFTGTKTDTKICVWDNANQKINCTYTDQLGEAGTTDGNNYTTGIFSDNSTDNITIILTIEGRNNLTTSFAKVQGPQGVQGIQGETGATGASGTNGTNGINGTNGVGVASAAISSGIINITLTNGSSFISTNLTGSQGAQGIQGVQGETGPSGTNGTNGLNGSNGVGIASGSIVAGIINVTLTNGSSFISNNLTGPQGIQGVPGSNATADGNNYTSSVSVTGTSTKSINLAIVGREPINATFADIDTTCSVDQSCPGILYDSNASEFYSSNNPLNFLNSTSAGALYITQTYANSTYYLASNPNNYASGTSNSTLYWISFNGSGLLGGNISTTGTVGLNLTYLNLLYNDTDMNYITASGVPGAETDSAHDECSEVSGCVVGAITDGNTGWDNSYGFITNATRNTSATDIEGTDLGTLSDTKWCVYDLAGTEIDCNVEPVVDTDDQTCSEVSGCVEGAITASQDQNNYTSGVGFNESGSTIQINLAISGRNNLTATFTDSDTTYSNGTGLSLSGTTFSHTDGSSVSNSDNSGNTFIQDITFDSLGHVATIGTGSVTESGDVEGVAAGTGLLGGGTSGNLTLNISAQTCGTGNYSYYNGSGFQCRSDVDTTATDGNNYTSAMGFNETGNTIQLNIARVGMNNLSATFTDSDTTYTAGTGLVLTGTEFTHNDTSGQASSDNGARTYIQDITLDTYGHITSLATAAETVTDTDTVWNISGSEYIANCTGVLCLNETALNSTVLSVASVYNDSSRIDSLNSSKIGNASSANLTSLFVVNNITANWVLASINWSSIINEPTNLDVDSTNDLTTASSWTGGDLGGTGLAATVADDSHLHTGSTVTIAGENVTSGTVADARIASTLARDSEVPGLETDSAHDECSEVSGCVVGAITSSQDQNNYTSSVSVTGTTTKSINVAITGRTAINATFTDLDTDTDTNNYTSSIGFNTSGSTLQLNIARTGMGNLSSTITMNDTTRAYPGTCTGQTALQTISSTGAATCVGFGTSNSTLVWIANGTGLVGGNITSGGSLSLATTAIVAGSYGNNTAVPVCTFDAYGRATGCTNTSISFPTDQNNYTSSAGFNGNTLQIAITGRTNVTASLTSLGAGNITAGAFGAGSYSFPSNVTVVGNLSANYLFATCTVYPSGFKVGDCD